MRLNQKFLGLAVIPVLVLLGSGCSGINATHSVSPATFFLPGLMKAEPPQPDPSRDLPESAPASNTLTS